MIMPAILLIHCNSFRLNRLLKTLNTPTRESHQSREPRNTPRIKIAAERMFPLVPAIPNPAKTAARDKMVMGFVSVRKNVEVYIPA